MKWEDVAVFEWRKRRGFNFHPLDRGEAYALLRHDYGNSVQVAHALLLGGEIYTSTCGWVIRAAPMFPARKDWEVWRVLDSWFPEEASA